MSHIPLLNAFQTFVVAGRHLNFTTAAEELSVSPSAVSHQIRILEKYINVKLFVRKNRGLELTNEGRRLHYSLEGPFDQIGRTVQELLSSAQHSSLNIVLRPFLSGTWLAPRLNRFWTKHPGLQLNLIHSIYPPNFSVENVDLAIVWGKGHWPNLATTLLIPGELTPILSRGLVERLGMPEKPDDLQRFVLIHDEDRSCWDSWLRAAGAHGVDCTSNLIFDDTNVRIQAILNGQGVMLGCPRLLREELEAGRLVRPFELSLESYSYYLVYPENTRLTPKMKLFINWLVEEARQT